MVTDNDRLAGNEQPVTEVGQPGKADLKQQQTPAASDTPPVPSPTPLPNPGNSGNSGNMTMATPAASPVRFRAMLARGIARHFKPATGKATIWPGC